MEVMYTDCLTCHNGEQMTQLGVEHVIHLCIKLHYVYGHVVGHCKLWYHDNPLQSGLGLDQA